MGAGPRGAAVPLRRSPAAGARGVRNILHVFLLSEAGPGPSRIELSGVFLPLFRGPASRLLCEGFLKGPNRPACQPTAATCHGGGAWLGLEDLASPGTKTSRHTVMLPPCEDLPFQRIKF